MASYAASALSVFSRYLTCMVISISKLPVHMCRFKQIKGYIALVPGSCSLLTEAAMRNHNVTVMEGSKLSTVQKFKWHT